MPSTHADASPARAIPITPLQLTPSSLNLLANNIHQSSMINHESQAHPSRGNEAKQAELIIQITQAAHCPPPDVSQALADFFFCELHHMAPVLDRGQKELESSLLLRQSLYLGGSGMRRSTEGPPEWFTSAIYKRTKTFLNHGPMPLNTPSALCIVASFPMQEGYGVALDNPWQWVGMAIRLALQLQMHTESAYLQFAHPGRIIRIWWYLFLNGTMQMGCSGRPGMFPLNECNVRLPTVADFNTPNAEALQVEATD